MAGQKTITNTYNPPQPIPPPPPIPDYVITGDGIPIPNGDYFLSGVEDGKPYYSRNDNAFHIYWWNVANRYLISPTIGYHEANLWDKVGEPIAGIYNHSGIYTGHPVIT